MAGRMGIMDKAYGNLKKRKSQDTTPTLDAQVVDLPKENENEKEIVVQRPDNDADKNVDLPAVSTGNNLIPPTNNPPVNLAALNGGEVAPMGNRDLAEDVEFTIDKQEPKGIEGYKQAGESWHTSTEEEQPKIEDKTEPEEQKKIEQDEKPALEDKSGIGEYEDVGTLKDPSDIGEYEDVAKWKDPKDKDDDEEEGEEDTEGKPADLSDLLNSGATDFSINDIVESEQEIPHYQYRSLLNRR